MCSSCGLGVEGGRGHVTAEPGLVALNPLRAGSQKDTPPPKERGGWELV